MKYQLGDIVLIQHSEEEGTIVDFINDKMVLVDVKGVKFPVYIDQIDFPYFKRFSEKKFTKKTKEKPRVEDLRREKGKDLNRVTDGVWLSFLPVMTTDEFGDELVEELKIHLINRTEATYDFVYRLSYLGEQDFELKNKIHPFEDFYLHDIPFENINDSPAFGFDFILTPSQKKKAEHFEATLKLKPKPVFNKIEELRKKNEATFSYLLFEQYPDREPEKKMDMGKLSAKGYKVYNAREARQHLESPRSVVDLHIEKLSNDWQHLSNFEIMTIQLRAFEKYYELALAHMQPSLIIIHGMGTGRLRDEIHDLLRMRNEVKSFVNQYDSRFGYGATEIFFQY